MNSVVSKFERWAIIRMEQQTVCCHHKSQRCYPTFMDPVCLQCFKDAA